MDPIVKTMLSLQKDTTYENFFHLMCDYGDRVAEEYSDGDEIKKITYNQFGQDVRGIAYRLGCFLGKDRQGQYVGVHFDNCPEWPSIFWGLLMAGYNPILLDFRAHRETLLHLLKESGAVAIITNEKEPIREGLIQYGKEELTSGKDEIPENWKPAWAKYVALCTSGTTNTSRVFVYDEKTIVGNVGAPIETYLGTPYLMDHDAKVLAFIPFYHIFGLFGMNFWPMMCGATIVYLKDRSPNTFVETCKKHNVTHVHAVPLLWNNIASKITSQLEQSPWYKKAIFHIFSRISLSLQAIAPQWGAHFAFHYLFGALHKKLLGASLRGTISGGAYLSPKTLRLLTALGIPIVGGYGMTEAGVISIEVGTSFQRRLKSSVGKPFPTVEVKIVPIGGNNTNGVGQLFLRSKSLHTGRMQGGNLVGPIREPDGWFDTGDLAEFKDNHLYLKGRCKDTIIKQSGEKVFPDELEDCFRGMPGVEELCIVGIRNSNNDEDITLVVNPGKNALTPELKIKMANHIGEINKRLLLYKRVNNVLISALPLPATTSMKAQRQKLQKMLVEKQWPCTPLEIAFNTAKASCKESKNSGISHEQPKPTEKDIRQKVQEEVKSAFAEVLNKPANTIRNDAHFVDELGGGSLEAIALARTLEQKYNISLPESVLLECTNVEEITEAVLKQIVKADEPEQLKVIKSKAKKTPIFRFEESREYKSFESYAKRVGNFNPYFVRHDSIVRDTSIVNGKEMINLASYNYVGLSGHPETIKAAQDAVGMYGTSVSGSRLLTGEKTLCKELEEELARWKGTEDSIVLVSGHATNVTFVGNFCNENDLILYDALSHNSIIQGCRLSKSDSKAFPHNDLRTLENILQQNRDYYEKVLIVVEGVYSMDGDIAPVPEFTNMKKRYNAFLMVDEAHSSCVLGETGKGVDEYFHLEPDETDIRMGTLSKGLGSCGGYLAGKKPLIEYLRYNLPGFVFSVGIPPASAAAALAAVRLMQKDHSMVERLHANIDFFLQEAHKRDLHTCLAQRTAIIPVLVGSEEAAFLISMRLKEKGVCVPPAVYPAVPKGKARLRFCVTSEHKKEQIVYAMDTLKEIAVKESIELPAFHAYASA